ncbi:MAG: hypothetical protein SF029_07100 [bacterium]|nr:hypothetical protein [bacterium]
MLPRRLLIGLMFLLFSLLMVWPAAAQDTDLPLTATSTDAQGGKLLLSFPDEWAAFADESGFRFSDSAETLNTFDPYTLEGDAFVLEVAYLSASEVNGTEADAVLNQVLDELAAEVDKLTTGAAEPFLDEGLLTTGEAESGAERTAATVSIIVAVRPLGEGYLQLVFYKAQEVLDDDLAVLTEMARSAAYVAPAVLTENNQGEQPSISLDLPQSISSTDASGGVLSVSYPENWVASEAQGTINIADSEETLGTDTPGVGQIFGSILFLPSDLLSGINLSQNATPEEVLRTFVSLLGEGGETSFDLDEPQNLENGDFGGALATGTAEGGGQTLAISLVVVEVEAGFALLIFGSAEGELSQYDTLIRAISNSVTYEPFVTGS